MNSKNNEEVICPICGEIMDKYPYAYDNNQYGKLYYKCDVCGHKEVKIIYLIIIKKCLDNLSKHFLFLTTFFY